VGSKWHVVSAAVADCTAAYSAGDRKRAQHLAQVASRLALRATPSSERDQIVESLAKITAMIDEVEGRQKQ
jgi:hypothetical protein